MWRYCYEETRKMIEPRKGETAAEFLKRCLQEAHDKTPITEPITASITYQFNGIDIDPITATFTPTDFKSYKEITKEDRGIHFEIECTPVDPVFIKWVGTHLVETKPEYRYDTLAGYAATSDKLNIKFMNTSCKKKKMDTKLKRLLR